MSCHDWRTADESNMSVSFVNGDNFYRHSTRCNNSAKMVQETSILWFSYWNSLSTNVLCSVWRIWVAPPSSPPRSFSCSIFNDANRDSFRLLNWYRSRYLSIRSKRALSSFERKCRGAHNGGCNGTSKRMEPSNFASVACGRVWLCYRDCLVSFVGAIIDANSSLNQFVISSRQSTETLRF
ncbi:DUF819 domain-containing protein [Skeletonema marinoi]|uniref:DUF819 domain-containing protein n=1 Tax=Skeletonema marinoi TaxID=267567 RepID=A0AAD9DJY2_9STRA|nr:DUF819 domain-containing protein [Skeletonema marinoi]